MKWVADSTGRFPRRPFYLPEELDTECERIVSGFLKDKYGGVSFPISTDDLSVMVERDTSDLDLYADLSEEGEDIEGTTDFYKDKKPAVRISRDLSQDTGKVHRLRTTLAHEYGHVKFHYFLWEMYYKAEKPDNFWKIIARRRRKFMGFRKKVRAGDANAQEVLPQTAGTPCRHALMVDAPEDDWMEWQAAYAGGALLMPLSTLNDFISSVRVKGIVDEVALKFDVSPEAAAARLRKLGLSLVGTR